MYSVLTVSRLDMKQDKGSAPSVTLHLVQMTSTKFTCLRNIRPTNFTQSKKIFNNFCYFFLSAGEVHWRLLLGVLDSMRVNSPAQVG